MRLKPLKILRLFLVLFLTLLILILAQTIQAADGPLPVQEVFEGNYCIAHSGVGLFDPNPGTFQISIQGAPVKAYLYWSGRYLTPTNGDTEVTIAINGGVTTTVHALQEEVSYAGYEDAYYYTYRSDDIATLLPGGGLLSVAVANLNTPEAYGAGLLVISTGPNCAYSRIVLNYGIDGFFWNFPDPAGPDTLVTCVDIPAATAARPLEIQMFVGGTASMHEPRPNRIWYAVGSGTPPTNIISGQNPANILAGPPLGQAIGDYPLNGDNGQWDTYVNTITIPAGATYACFQIESIDNDDPLGVSAVWVELSSRFLLNPGLAVAKQTNGLDATHADDPDVPVIAPGAPVTWTYLVTNTGQVPFDIAQVSVTDSVEGAVTEISEKRNGNSNNSLEPGEVWVYRKVGVARTLSNESGALIVQGCGNAATGGLVRNTYANNVLVQSGVLTATDTSHYCNPLIPGLAVVKLTNGFDAKNANDVDVPVIAPGVPVTWTYLVTNTGQAPFDVSQVRVTDSVEGIVTEISEKRNGDTDTSLESGETWVYRKVGVARILSNESGAFIVQGCGNAATGGFIRNTYANSVTVQAGQLTVTDTSHYCNPTARAAVGNRVFGDINPLGITPDDIVAGNGLQDNDPREQGINGIIVELRTSSGVVVSTTVTANGGEYFFGNLEPGDYYLVFINPQTEGIWSASNQGSDDTIDSDAAIAVIDPRGEAQRTELFTLAPGVIDHTWDAGLVGLSGTGSAALGNFVWNDLNHNGLQDAGESGISGVTVRLYHGNGILLKEMTTTVAGLYGFGALDPGTYIVEFVLPSDFKVTLQNVGNNDDLDSDIDPITKQTAIFTVPSFTTDLRWDAGLFQPTALGDADEPIMVRLFLPVIKQ